MRRARSASSRHKFPSQTEINCWYTSKAVACVHRIFRHGKASRGSPIRWLRVPSAMRRGGQLRTSEAQFAGSHKATALLFFPITHTPITTCAIHPPLVPLPAGLDETAFPGEPLGCAMNIFQRSNIGKEHTVAIVGVGFLGALLTQLASATGARVIALSRRGFALSIAEEMGATSIARLDHDAIETVRCLTSDRLCDIVIECTGKQSPLDIAGEITRERGRLVIAGYHQDGPRQINMQLWNWRGLDVINAHERNPRVYVDGIRQAIRAVEAGLLNPVPLYTHSFPLERLGDAFNMVAQRPEGFMKALIKT